MHPILISDQFTRVSTGTKTRTFLSRNHISFINFLSYISLTLASCCKHKCFCYLNELRRMTIKVLIHARYVNDDSIIYIIALFIK